MNTTPILTVKINQTFSSLPHTIQVFPSHYFAPLLSVLVVQLPFNTMALVLNFLLIRLQLRNTNFDKAIRTLAINWSISYIVSNAFLMVKSALIVSGFKGTTGSIRFYTSGMCILQDFPIVVGYLVSMFTMFAIAIDRYLATRHHDSYGEYGPQVALSMALATWPLSVTLFISIFPIFALPKLNQTICNCANSAHVYFFISAMCICMSLNWFVVVGYRYLVSHNQILLQEFLDSQIYISLSGRLQLRRNISATTALLPAVITGASLWFVADGFVVAALYYSNFVPNSYVASMFLTYGCHLLCSVQSVLHPLITIGTAKRIRFTAVAEMKRFRSRLPWLRNHLLSGTPINDGDIYFERLSSEWTVSYTRRNNLSEYLNSTRTTDAILSYG